MGKPRADANPGGMGDLGPARGRAFRSYSSEAVKAKFAFTPLSPGALSPPPLRSVLPAGCRSHPFWSWDTAHRKDPSLFFAAGKISPGILKSPGRGRREKPRLLAFLRKNPNLFPLPGTKGYRINTGERFSLNEAVP